MAGKINEWMDGWSGWKRRGLALGVHLSAEINVGRAQQHGLGLIGASD